jgi:hypothetical protein
MPVCIAGMHRSGTSMVARLLNLCGLSLGEAGELLEPASDNPAGYWENTHFSVLNEKILARLGGAWDMPPPLAAGWESQAGLASLRAEAERLVDHFRAYPVWGWKDPRNSLTLPFWKSVIPDLKVVICLRHPLAVAWSLNARGQSSLLFGLALWHSYNRPWLAAPSADWIVTHYEAYFDDPARELRRVVSRLGLEVSDEAFRQACQSVDAPLHHQRATAEGFSLSDIPGPIIQLYETLCAQAEWTDHTLTLSEPARVGESLFASTLPPAEDQPTAQLLALERLLLEKDRAVAFLNSQFEERQRAVAFLNVQLEDRERAVAFLNSQLEERQRAVDSLKAQLQERALAMNQWQQAHTGAITGLQQELQAVRATAEATAAELESLRRTKFYRVAALYWQWLDKLKKTVRGRPSLK